MATQNEDPLSRKERIYRQYGLYGPDELPPSQQQQKPRADRTLSHPVLIIGGTLIVLIGVLAAWAGAHPSSPSTYYQAGGPANIVPTRASVSPLASVPSHSYQASPSASAWAPAPRQPAVEVRPPAADLSAWHAYAAAAHAILQDITEASNRAYNQANAGDAAGLMASIVQLRRDAEQLANLQSPDPALQAIAVLLASDMEAAQADCYSALTGTGIERCRSDLQTGAQLLRRLSQTTSGDMERLGLQPVP